MHVTWLGTCTRPSMRLQRRWAAWRTLKLWTISRSWWPRAVTRRMFGAKLTDKPMFATLPQTIISPNARAKTLIKNVSGLIYSLYNRILMKDTALPTLHKSTVKHFSFRWVYDIQPTATGNWYDWTCIGCSCTVYANVGQRCKILLFWARPYKEYSYKFCHSFYCFISLWKNCKYHFVTYCKTLDFVFVTLYQNRKLTF